jgi:crotonobetainyl-CoA:carnitine CoA-transferase CaiB-like acyl-CoA transferase
MPSPVTSSKAPGALSGIRVIDLTRMLAGPLCTALLADIGAEVIKIENPDGGDDARQFHPRKGNESTYFMLLNRGKKSLTVDLKSKKGLALIEALVEKSDVLVENFRPGTVKRLGIDYERLSKINPRLIYASISGFGQTGPLSHQPSYDIIAQAMSGLMSITGAPDGPPTRVGESIGDITAGLYASWGILAALQARARSGRGQHLDIAMFDSLFSLLVTPLSQYFFTGVVPHRVGNRHPVSTPFDTYRASDGLVVIAVANNSLFAKLAEAIGHPEFATDARFSSDDRRTANEPALRVLIEQWTSTRTVAEVIEHIGRAGVPVSPIWTVAQAADSDHVRSRGIVHEVNHPTAGAIKLVEQPVRFSESASDVAASPLLGEHTDKVLHDILGLGDGAIAELRAGKVI